MDLDGSGTIEFNEFLDIMLKIKRGKSGSGTNKNSAMFDFFSRNNVLKSRDEYRTTRLRF